MKNEVINIDGVLFLKLDINNPEIWEPVAYGSRATIRGIEGGEWSVSRCSNLNSDSPAYHYELF